MSTVPNNKETISFIGNEEMLKENVVSMSDSSIFNQAFEQVHRLTKKNQSTFIALVGAPGVGKSTFFHNFLDDIGTGAGKKQTFKRFKFDVWEVPGRKYLWDAFVLEFAKNIRPDFYKKIKGGIDGESEGVKEKILKGTSVRAKFRFLSAEVNLKEFFQKTPAKRVSEYQLIFKEILEKVTEDTIYITLEDIDRSGEEGLYFIETLQKFIDSYSEKLKKQFIVLVPLLSTEYTKEDKQYRFEKVFEHILYFDELKKDNSALMRNVLSDILVKDYDQKMIGIDNYQDGIAKIVWALQGVPIRDLKHYIRKADSICREYYADKGQNLIFSFVVFLVWMSEKRGQYVEEEKLEDGSISYKARNKSIFYKFIQIVDRGRLNHEIHDKKYVAREEERYFNGRGLPESPGLSGLSGYFHKGGNRPPISPSGRDSGPFNHRVSYKFWNERDGDGGVFMDKPYLNILARGAQ